MRCASLQLFLETGLCTSERDLAIFSTRNLSPDFSFILRTPSHGRCDGWAKVLPDSDPRRLAIHLLWIRRAEVAKKLNVARNGSMSLPTAGQSTCTGRFLSPLHACLSLNTWQVKPDSTGSGLTRGGYGRRRGDARSDPKCLNLCVHCMCGCSNLPSHRSFPSIPLSLFLSFTLSLFLLSKVTVILVVCSQAWIATLFCGRTMWGS